MEPRVLEVGEIVQLSPTWDNQVFAGCLMVVEESKRWGARGYVHTLGADGKIGSQADLRVDFADMEPTGGRAVWMADGDEAGDAVPK